MWLHFWKCYSRAWGVVLIAVPSWCLMCALALVWVLCPATSLQLLGVTGKLSTKIHIAPSQNSYMDKEDASSTTRSGIKGWEEIRLLFYSLCVFMPAAASWVPRVKVICLRWWLLLGCNRSLWPGFFHGASLILQEVVSPSTLCSVCSSKRKLLPYSHHGGLPLHSDTVS